MEDDDTGLPGCRPHRDDARTSSGACNTLQVAYIYTQELPSCSERALFTLRMFKSLKRARAKNPPRKSRNNLKIIMIFAFRLCWYLFTSQMNKMDKGE